MEKYTIEFPTEAEFVEFKKTLFEKELQKVEKRIERLKKNLQELKKKREEIIEEFRLFKSQYPNYFRRGRKKKDG
ncbi:MAG: V-type ATPase 116kDa subunit family protein [Epsilonproteobacteria bacterium]|nr:hypothetical protein [Campylobacterota bacterium]NPA57179.1 V-type ATPase 116kDa subunit family protein [Campylobacterota bacterium]